MDRNKLCYLREYKADNYIYELSERHIIYELANLKQLTFEVTDACNLKCKYCGYGEFYNTHDKRENKYLAFKTAKIVIDYLYDIWRKFPGSSNFRTVVVGFYGGEPLLNMNLIQQIISYLNSLPVIPHTVFKYNMTTNAMLLNRYMDYLVKNEFTLLLSLDGDEYGQSYRVDSHGRNSFIRVVQNIRKLKDRYPDYFKKYVSFNSVLHDRNSTRSIQEFIYKEFGKVSQVSELNNFGICESKQEEFDKLFHKIIDDISISDTDFTEHFPDMVGLFRFVGRMSGNYFVSHNYLLKKSPNKSCPTGTCMPFGKKMFITVNGKILPCERIDQKYTLGCITDKGIELDLAKVARMYSDYYHKIKPSCERCYLKAFCSQCMFYMENLDGQVKCPSFSNEESIRKYINYYSNILQNHPELYKKVSTEILLQL